MKYMTNLRAYTSLCGTNCELSLIGTMQVVQDLICEYFGEMNADQISTKKKFNSVWIFLRNKFKFTGRIYWNEDYRAECFISLRTSAKIIVDTAFYNCKNELSMYAKTEICLMDLANFRLRRISGDILAERYKPCEPLIDMEFEKFVEQGEKCILSQSVVSTNIDFCAHCNNVEYMRFVLNSYSADEIKNLDLDTFEICYVNQSLEGEVLDVYATTLKNVDFFEIKNKDKVVLKCKLVKK